MLLDKGNDVIRLLLLRFETAFPLLRDNEFVVADAPPLAVQPDIRGIAQAVAPVQVIARVNKHVLNVQPAQKIVISQFALSHGLPPHSHIIDFTVHFRLETTDGYIPRRIDTRFEIRAWRTAETLAVELQGMAVMVDAVRDTRRDYRTCGEGRQRFSCRDPVVLPGVSSCPLR